MRDKSNRFYATVVHNSFVDNVVETECKVEILFKQDIYALKDNQTTNKKIFKKGQVVSGILRVYYDYDHKKGYLTPLKRIPTMDLIVMKDSSAVILLTETRYSDYDSFLDETMELSRMTLENINFFRSSFLKQRMEELVLV